MAEGKKAARRWWLAGIGLVLWATQISVRAEDYPRDPDGQTEPQTAPFQAKPQAPAAIPAPEVRPDSTPVPLLMPPELDPPGDGQVTNPPGPASEPNNSQPY